MQVVARSRIDDNYAMERFPDIMLVRVALVLCVALLSTDTLADNRRDTYCRELAKKIRKIEARMRQPYTAAQGIRLDARLRELKRERYRRCRW